MTLYDKIQITLMLVALAAVTIGLQIPTKYIWVNAYRVAFVFALIAIGMELSEVWS